MLTCAIEVASNWYDQQLLNSAIQATIGSSHYATNKNIVKTYQLNQV